MNSQLVNTSHLVKYRKASPYTDSGSTRFPLRGKKGVYLIYKNGADAPAYVGMSGSDLYKAMYRHFNSWTDWRQVRVVYDRASVMVRVVYTRTAAQAERLEKALIIKYRPADSPDKLQKYSLSVSDSNRLAELDAAPAVAVGGIVDYAGDVPF